MFLSYAHTQHTQVNTWGEKIRTASEIRKTRMPVGSIPEKEKGINARKKCEQKFSKTYNFGMGSNDSQYLSGGQGIQGRGEREEGDILYKSHLTERGTQGG